ncbi:hypothetical protein [Tabrizicola sp.]|uniref:hypothetical protein n=1 Tax=Tabrizicola sp. TaxID=2005166 RepID=UPI0035B2C061
MLKPLLWIIAASQLVLAALTLFTPLQFFGWMGLTVPAADNGYMIGMLGARFLAYGIGMAMLARSAQPSRFWIANMALIQAVDLGLALVYVGLGLVPLAVAAFPAMNAALFTAGLLWCLRGAGLRAA